MLRRCRDAERSTPFNRKVAFRSFVRPLTRRRHVTTTVAIIGFLLLIYFAVLVGMEMDTDRQRRERQRLAAKRRKWRIGGAGMCDDCPWKDFLDE